MNKIIESIYVVLFNVTCESSLYDIKLKWTTLSLITFSLLLLYLSINVSVKKWVYKVLVQQCNIYKKSLDEHQTY